MFFLDDESGITSKSNNEDICTESDINCFMDDNDKLFEYISKAKSNSQNFIANVQDDVASAESPKLDKSKAYPVCLLTIQKNRQDKIDIIKQKRIIDLTTEEKTFILPILQSEI